MRAMSAHHAGQVWTCRPAIRTLPSAGRADVRVPALRGPFQHQTDSGMTELPENLVMSLPISTIAAAALSLLIVALALNVSRLRLRLQISLGDGERPELSRAIRAHGNTVENVPLFLVLCLLLELTGSGAWLGWLTLLFVLGRYVYAWGMLRRNVSRQRQIGALLSYLIIAGMSLALLSRLA